MPQHIRRRAPVLLATATALVLGNLASVSADGERPITEIITEIMATRGASVQLAPSEQLCRRYAIDLTGAVPSLADLRVCEGKTPAEMFDHFRSKGPLPHTDGDDAFVWVSLLHDADHFLFSNSSQFSQVGHVREARDQLRRVYREGWSYAAFARWALTSQMFLNRFPSGADRANAAFFLFLGRDSLASEVPVGNMWNVYRLRDPDIAASQAENDPDYHVHDLDPERCDNGRTFCRAELWGVEGDRPEVAIESMVSSTLFAEATVSRYFERYVGHALPVVDYPEILRSLALELVARDYDIPWLIREIATSPAYTQEMMYR